MFSLRTAVQVINFKFQIFALLILQCLYRLCLKESARGHKASEKCWSSIPLTAKLKGKRAPQFLLVCLLCC